MVKYEFFGMRVTKKCNFKDLSIKINMYLWIEFSGGPHEPKNGYSSQGPCCNVAMQTIRDLGFELHTLVSPDL